MPKPLVKIAVDTGLPFALLFQRGRQFADKVQYLIDDKTLKLSMFLPSSVDKECRRKIDDVMDRLGEHHREFKQYLQSAFFNKGQADIGEEDVIKLQKYFGRRVWKYQDERLKEEVRAYEFAIITRVRKYLQRTDKTPIVDLLVELGNWLQTLYNDYNDQYDELNNQYWPVEQITPHRQLVKLLKDVTQLENIPDLTHIASAVLYGLQKDTWVIFCSLDYTDIVVKTIFEAFFVFTTDPVYVFFCYRQLLTRCKGRRLLQFISKMRRHKRHHNDLFSIVERHHKLKVLHRR